MKKIVMILCGVAFLVTLLSSCKTREKCPAFSKNNSFEAVKS